MAILSSGAGASSCWSVSMLVFAITSLLPANVAYLILGPFAPPEQVKALELKLGLNDPVLAAISGAGPRGFCSGDLGEFDADEPADRPAARGGDRPLADAHRRVLRADCRDRRRARRDGGAAPRTAARPRRLGRAPISASPCRSSSGRSSSSWCSRPGSAGCRRPATSRSRRASGSGLQHLIAPTMTLVFAPSRPRVAADPLQHDRGDAEPLRHRGARQGPARARRGAAPRAAQRAAADHHRAGARLRPADGRHRRHRDGLRLSGPGPAAGLLDPEPRHPDAAGRDPRRRGDLRVRQSRRPTCSTPGSIRRSAMAAASLEDCARCDAPRARALARCSSRPASSSSAPSSSSACSRPGSPRIRGTRSRCARASCRPTRPIGSAPTTTAATC